MKFETARAETRNDTRPPFRSVVLNHFQSSSRVGSSRMGRFWETFRELSSSLRICKKNHIKDVFLTLFQSVRGRFRISEYNEFVGTVVFRGLKLKFLLEHFKNMLRFPVNLVEEALEDCQLPERYRKRPSECFARDEKVV